MLFSGMCPYVYSMLQWKCSWIHVCDYTFMINGCEGYNYGDYTFNWLSYTNVTVFPINAYRWISNQSAHSFSKNVKPSDNKN